MSCSSVYHSSILYLNVQKSTPKEYSLGLVVVAIVQV